MLRLCCALVLSLAGSAALADLSGPLHVIDGDTYTLGETRIRLHGIDALEHDQRCGGANAPMWGCGAWVTGEVRARYEGRPAICTAVDTDRYGRTVARCTVHGQDLGAALVEGGLAFAYPRYSDAYVPHEGRARKRGAGLHGLGVQSPSAYRADRRRGYAAQRVSSAPEGCTIKGNVSSDGGARIYHVPGQAWYAATRISPDKGERWFCSEAEARAAGWRRARR